MSLGGRGSSLWLAVREGALAFYEPVGVLRVYGMQSKTFHLADIHKNCPLFKFRCVPPGSSWCKQDKAFPASKEVGSIWWWLLITSGQYRQWENWDDIQPKGYFLLSDKTEKLLKEMSFCQDQSSGITSVWQFTHRHRLSRYCRIVQWQPIPYRLTGKILVECVVCFLCKVSRTRYEGYVTWWSGNPQAELHAVH